MPRPTGQGHMAPGEWSAEAGPSGQAHARNVQVECAAPALTWQGPLHALPHGKALARARCPAPTRREGHVAAGEWSAEAVSRLRRGVRGSAPGFGRSRRQKSGFSSRDTLQHGFLSI